ncbi:MAG: glycosyltransferase [bacterium]
MSETSVIIPTCNRLSFLKEAVDSVLNQTCQNFELIIVDDGSTDGTQKYAETIRDRVTYLHKENSGPSSARNLGIRQARGQLIAFLDSDDLWRKNKLKVQLDFMTSHPEAMVCFTDEIWIRRGVRVNPRKIHQKSSGWIFEQCVPRCIVSPSSVLMKKEFFDRVGMFDESLPACEDYDFWLRGALRFPFHFIPQKLIVKRGGHPDQLSAQWGLDRYRVHALVKLLKEASLTSEQRRLVVQMIIEKCRILELGFVKREKQREAAFYRKIAQDVGGCPQNLNTFNLN